MTQIKTIILGTIRSRWTRLVENSTGFPDCPPEDVCWTWTGALKSGRPFAKLLDYQVSPRSILYELHKGVHPILQPVCGNPRCINPTHMREMGIRFASEPLPTFDINKVDWAQLFKDMGLSNTLTPEEIVNQSGAPLEAARKWSTCK